MHEPTRTVGLPPRCCLTCRAEWDERAEEAGVPPGFIANMRTMTLCPGCSNKRCPKATDHRLDCTGSNAGNQDGSAYQYNPAALEAEDCECGGIVKLDLIDGVRTCGRCGLVA